MNYLGSIYALESSIVLQNVTLDGNTSDGLTAGVASILSEIHISNSTFAN